MMGEIRFRGKELFGAGFFICYSGPRGSSPEKRTPPPLKKRERFTHPPPRATSICLRPTGSYLKEVALGGGETDAPPKTVDREDGPIPQWHEEGDRGCTVGETT